MKASLFSRGALLLVFMTTSLATPARRNKQLEQRRDKGLAAEAATAAAVAPSAAAGHMTSSPDHLAAVSSDSSEKIPASGQTTQQRNLLLKAEAESKRGHQAHQSAPIRSYPPLPSHEQMVVRPPLFRQSRTSNGMPKRVVIKIGGKPINGGDVQFSPSAFATSSASHNSNSYSSAISGMPHANTRGISEENTSKLDSASLLASPSDSTQSSDDGSFGDSSNSVPEIHQNPQGQLNKMRQPSAISLPKKSKAVAGRPLRTQKKEYFEKEWRNQNLGVHMPALALADSIKMMSAAGLDPYAAKALSGKKLKSMPSQDYHDVFSSRIAQWNTAVGNAKRAFSADPSFAKLSPEERMKKVYQRASRSVEENKLDAYRAKVEKTLTKEYGLRGRNKMAMKDKQALVEEIGRAFKERLARKKLDFDTMSIEELEVEARNLGHEDVHPLTYPKVLVGYIGRYRSKNEMMRYRNERLKYNLKKSRELAKQQDQMDE